MNGEMLIIFKLWKKHITYIWWPKYFFYW